MLSLDPNLSKLTGLNRLRLSASVLHDASAILPQLFFTQITGPTQARDCAIRAYSHICIIADVCANAQPTTLAAALPGHKTLCSKNMKQPSTKAEFDAVLTEAAAAGKAVVVDFTATWCGPCQRIAPLFAQLASEFPQAEFIKVDVDENQETAAACQVSAMPTFMVFRDKREVGMIRGADPNGLRALITQHAGDKWSVAGEGQSLGSSQDTGGMSEREKRLAALERRGL